MPLPVARLTLHPEFVIGTIDPRLYGSFIEHLGRCVYGGIYEPGHPQADERGFRRDVLALVRELGVPIVRYPGGNFVSGYNWEDGVGPRDQRPRRLDPAWNTIETNLVGTNEFIDWCTAAGTEPFMAVNLGTRGAHEARSLLEYCNVPGGTALSDLRHRHGYPDPHRIKTWCLGNEMDGPWQMGHKTADEYGRLACETGRLMKMIDPAIELVVCGSSNGGMSTFPDWDATVLGHAGDVADYISLHLYIAPKEGPLAEVWNDYLAQPVRMDRQIETIAATTDYVQARLRSRKRVMLAFDEWNVWWHSQRPDFPKPAPWSIAPPLVEDIYTHADALVAGGLLLSLLRHADRVRLACLAQLVNVIAPIMTENGGVAWRQTVFWPFLHASRHGRGESLRLSLAAPEMKTDDFGPVPVLDAAATRNRADGTVTIFAVNRSRQDTLLLEADLRAFGPGARVIEHIVLESDDPEARNTAAQPDRVTPHTRGDAAIRDGALQARLPAASWNVVRIQT